MKLDKHQRMEIEASSNILLKALNSDNEMECRNLLQLAACTIYRVLDEYKMATEDS